MKTFNQSQQLIVNPQIIEFLGSLTGKTALDAGCGNGYWTRRMAQTAKRVVGIDKKGELIRSIKSGGVPENAEFIIGNLEKLLLTKNTFDVVLMNMILPELEDLFSVIKEIERIMKPEGKVIATMAHPSFEKSSRYSLADYINAFANNHLYIEKIVELDNSGFFNTTKDKQPTRFLVIRYRKILN